MCSATFSELEAAIVKKVLGVPGGQWKVYQTAKEFQTGKKLTITFNKTVPRNEAVFAVEMTSCIQNAKKSLSSCSWRTMKGRSAPRWLRLPH